MDMRRLPFGARISEEFIEHLKRATAKARAESPEVLPCLWVEEKQRYEYLAGAGPQTMRIDLEKSTEIAPVNGLAPGTRPAMLIKERICVLNFDTRAYKPEATFNIDGLQLHVPQEAQAELRGAYLNVVDDRKIVATYDPI